MSPEVVIVQERQTYTQPRARVLSHTVAEAQPSSVAGSLLPFRRDLCGEGLRDDLSGPNDEGISSQFVKIVRRFCCPEHAVQNV